MLRSNGNAVRRFVMTVLWAALGVLPAQGHDIPSDVTLQAFVKPEATQLRFLVRVPLAAMNEVDFPRRGPYLDLPRADAALRNAATLWLIDNIEWYADDVRLGPPRIAGVRVSLPSDRSFATYPEALAHMAAPPLPPATNLVWNQGLLDVLLEYPIADAGAAFALRPRLDRLGLKVTTALRFLPPNGAERAFELHGDPGLVRLDPRWHQAALRFVVAGFLHILEGTDHLLFLLCLVIPFRRLKPLVLIVTAFTVAHSITLIAAAYGLGPDALWFPPLIEVLIALSILYMAIENITGSSVRRRWTLAFAFGLVHGFGFSFALREQLQFAGSHLLTSLLSFNVGVELGQLLVLVVLVPVLNLVMRHLATERIVTIVLSVMVGHTAWHWMTERADQLRQFPWPAFDAAMLAGALRWLMALVALAGLVWVVDGIIERRLRRRETPPR